MPAKTRTPHAPVSDPMHRPQPSTGMVQPMVEQTSDGVNDPTYWQGLDVVSQGAVAEALPQPPQTEAEWQYQVEKSIETSGETSPDAPQISGLAVGGITAADAVVTWTTDKAASAQVRYGTVAGQYGMSTATVSDGSTTHSVTLSGLTALTPYFVQAVSRGGDGNIGSATTEFTTL